MNKRISFSDFYYENGYDLPFCSDKGTTHNYIDGYYDREFSLLSEEKLNILEIGISTGGSIHLLSKFFKNSVIYGIDIHDVISDKFKSIKVDSNAKLLFGNAYDESMLNLFPSDYFDYVIDDGPHSFESQCYSITNWLKTIKKGGKLIIEDIQSQNEVLDLVQLAKSNHMCSRATIIDLRLNKSRYDDFILEIIKK
jgi:hypothetical protein